MKNVMNKSHHIKIQWSKKCRGLEWGRRLVIDVLGKMTKIPLSEFGEELSLRGGGDGWFIHSKKSMMGKFLHWYTCTHAICAKHTLVQHFIRIITHHYQRQGSIQMRVKNSFKNKRCKNYLCRCAILCIWSIYCAL